MPARPAESKNTVTFWAQSVALEEKTPLSEAALRLTA
jgi:hypothetical protein